MKISHIINIFAFVVLLVATASVSLAIWASRQSDFHNYRISLAHTSYEQHLRLTADTYLLFKRFGDLLLAGDAERVNDVSEISERLRGHLDAIRGTIEAEIALVGDEELEELELLAEMERVIGDLSGLMKTSIERDDFGDVRSNWREVSLALNDNIKSDFRTLIAVALEEEQEEVAETEAEASAQMSLVRQLSYVIATIFLLVTALVLVLFHREFRTPFDRLLKGVRELAAGNLETRVGLKGRSELSEISSVLDEMAQVVAARTENLTAQNEQLEEAVLQRTQTLEKLLGEARKSEENRRQLLADVSHELRTPLTVIQGESDIALRGGDKSVEEYKEALNRSRIAANHTANLINDLLFIARNEAGSLKLSRESINLEGLVEEVIDLSGVAASVTTSAKDITLQGDAKRVRQAVLALLENAKRYGGQHVEVALVAHKGMVEITVSDDGAGISDAEKETAFERFFRGSNAGSRYTEGLGLGLPIVRSILEAHGGTARIFDRDPQGTRIVLTFPQNPTKQERA